MITDNDIIKEFSDKNGNINPNKTKITWLNKHQDIKLYLDNRYPNDNFVSYKFTLQRIFNGIEDLPLCKKCGKKLYSLYGQWCDTTCQLTDKNFIEHREKNKDKETQIKKWKENFYNKDINERNKIFEKGIKTKINKYGENFGEKIYLKCKETWLNKYGVEHIFQTNEFKEKSNNTKLIKYGNISYTNREKAKKTCLDKYGVENWMSSNEFKLKSFKTKLEKYGDGYFVNHDKYKETCLNKYGVDNFGKTQESILKTHTKEVNEKREYTKRINKTLNSSKTELDSYNLLKQKYSDVIHHYKDNDRYPFNCDFYIPSLDLFIECQYGQFHHGRPYLGTEEDLKDIEILKQKAKRRCKETGKYKSKYDSELETWTIRDVNKRNIAKQNNLNFIEFWNINELKNYINI